MFSELKAYTRRLAEFASSCGVYSEGQAVGTSLFPKLLEKKEHQRAISKSYTWSLQHLRL